MTKVQIFTLLSEESSASVFSETGRRVIMSDLKSGDYFGEFSPLMVNHDPQR